MSATQDKNQKAAFVYSNLYHLAKKDPHSLVLRVGNAKALPPGEGPSLSARDFFPTELIGKRIPKPDYLPKTNSEAIASLKDNLKNLKDLHSRLRFMLQELEDLVKE